MGKFNPDDIFNAMRAAAVGMVFSEYERTLEQDAMLSGILDALCSPMEWDDVRVGGVDLSATEYELGHPGESGAPF